MEGVIALFLIFVGYVIFTMVFSAGVRTVGAAAKTAVGRGSFSENMELAFTGMSALEARLHENHLGESNEGPLVKEIQVKGLFPVSRSHRVGFVTSVFDETSGEYEPVISAIEEFQEPYSIVYQHSTDLGGVGPDQGFVKWERVGVVLPQILQTPYGGERKLAVILRLVDLDNRPDITNGFHETGHTGLLWQDILQFTYTVEEKGYEEAAEHRDKARVASLKIAMAVAMADGSLDETEGNVLKDWVVRAISPFTESKREHLKQLYNDAMREAHASAIDGDLSLSDLTAQLNELGERSTKYEAIELCFDVMAADGVADPEELRVIRKVAEALELDFDEIEKMRDQRIVGLDTSVSNQASAEDMLGIESDWDSERIKKHLRAEFQKWNNRLNSLPEGDERENAQKMLERVSEARKKYG